VLKSRLLMIEQRLLREGLRAVLPEGYEVVAETSTGKEALILSAHTRPDIAIVGLPVPDIHPDSLITKLRQESPRIRVLVLSALDNVDVVTGVLRAGAVAFVAKTAAPEILIAALLNAASGHFYVCPEAASKLAEYIHRGGANLLSVRERQVLEAIAAGSSSKEIAEQLHLELSTIQGYRKTLMRKLGAQNVAALLRAADRQGLLAGGVSRDGLSPAPAGGSDV